MAGFSDNIIGHGVGYNYGGKELLENAVEMRAATHNWLAKIDDVLGTTPVEAPPVETNMTPKVQTRGSRAASAALALIDQYFEDPS